MSLFPIIQPSPSAPTGGELPVFRDVAWNFETGTAIFRDGEPVIVEKLEALLSWVWRALNVPRFRHLMYTTDYGSETDALIGRAYTEELKQSEAIRYVREALLPNPYIKDTRELAISFAEDGLHLSGILETIYGEVHLNV